ncbi:unnamed protein product [Natator depressus]
MTGAWDLNPLANGKPLERSSKESLDVPSGPRDTADDASRRTVADDDKGVSRNVITGEAQGSSSHTTQLTAVCHRTPAYLHGRLTHRKRPLSCRNLWAHRWLSMSHGGATRSELLLITSL